MLCKVVCLFCIFTSLVCCEEITTFYGIVEVQEPVLIELIHCPAMQRLKEIHQYGVAYYTTHSEEYNRYDHSIGVFALLRRNHASLKEQIAGLLHDVSHTVFSHVGDWIFGKEYQEEDYQCSIFRIYLTVSGIEEILMKHGYTLDSILPKKQAFTMLEQSLPNLCADRIDYNIQGAFYQGFLTKEEAIAIFEDMTFIDGRWISTNVDLLRKLVRFSIFMTRDCWGSAANYMMSRYLADAMIIGLQQGLLSWKEIHFGVDNDVWSKLQLCHHSLIQKKISIVNDVNHYYHLTNPLNAEKVVKFRCRAIDPWIVQDGQTVRLTSVDEEVAREFAELQEQAARGWPIQILETLVEEEN